MIVVAAICFAFGFLSKSRMSVAPFVLANVLLLGATVLGGLAMSLSPGVVALQAVVALVATQCGYVARVVVERRRTRASVAPSIETVQQPVRSIDNQS